MLRRMNAADVPATFLVRTATVENAITREELARRHGITPESVAASLQGTVTGWVWEQDGDVTGFCMAEGDTGEVLVLATLPSAEGQGVGRSLLGAACDWLFAQGHDELFLWSNPDPGVRAHGFYRHLGWKARPERHGDDEKLVLRRPAGDNAAHD